MEEGVGTRQRRTRWSGMAKALGPGIMYAGTAIGVSHLVQSTHAGADYGFSLVWAVVIVHLLKYPFFEYAYRYTAVTGESLLMGYQRVGRWALIGYLLVSFGMSIPSVAVLTIITAGMASQMFAINLSVLEWELMLLIFCMGLLAAGGYPLLDRVMKVLMLLLAACTLVVLVAAAGHHGARVAEFVPPEIWDVTGIAFLVALMGWMPTPVDASAWPSLWMQERTKQTRHRPSLGEALLDFNLGFAASLVTALMFLSLGALVMFGTGETIAHGAADFAAQFVGMYTNVLGDWSRPVIILVALTTMLSTTLTVLDGYPRALAAGARLAWPGVNKLGPAPYWVTMIIMVSGALAICQHSRGIMRTVVDVAMTLAFLSAPFFAYLNVLVISRAKLPEESAPPKWLRLLSWVGLVFLTCFSVLFLVVHFAYAG